MIEGKIFSDWETIDYENQKTDTGYEYCFIYGLCYDRTENVFYVGQSVQPDIRFREHIKKAYDDLPVRCKKYKLIRRICRSGNLIKMRILEKVPYEQALAAELRWINRYFDMGLPLTNDMKRVSFWGNRQMSQQVRAHLRTIEKHEL